MKIIVRLFALLLFVIFFGFALKNTDEVVLHLFWNAQTKSPLILLLLAFFVAGAVLGVLAMSGTVLRHRRELTRYKKWQADQQKEAEAALLAVTREEVEGFMGKEVWFRAGERQLPFTAEDFLMSFSLPNFYFHAATAYDILRWKGVPLGKRDYIGRLRMKA